MRQVVNGTKGGPLLGHSSCIIRSTSQCEVNNFIQQKEEEEDEHEDDMMMLSEDIEPEFVELDCHIQERPKPLHSTSPKAKGPRQQIERERRLRREIANSNERRRMQSINQGYLSLKRMLPAGDNGEKLSKAAVLQNAADYMVQLLDERNQLVMRNAELTQAIGSQRQQDEALPIRRKRDVTESSDEGISMSYQPVNHESEVIDELRRTVAELRIQLERESQRRTLLEQSYTYSLMAAQAASQAHVNSEQIPTTIMSNPLSPPQSRHASTDEMVYDRLAHRSPEMYDQSAANALPSVQHQTQQTFGKASTVASQNLSIIVEAINHLEGDTSKSSADKEVDSGFSQGESSDEAKSERSVSGTPQPPPAHQPAALLSAITHHRKSAYPPAIQEQAYCHLAAPPTSAVPLLYRPTFLSNYISNQSSLSNNFIATSQ